MATVKGDVHDIGKNIVGVVLACNNYEVIDLGVMVPAAKILEVAKDRKVDIIGLSGLITPSLDEMVHVAAEMEREGFAVPLLIGGATTSRVHTAVKVHPKYARGQAVYVTDASRAVGVVSNLLSPEARDGFVEQTRAEYRRVADAHARSEGRQAAPAARQGAGEQDEGRLERVPAAAPKLSRHPRDRGTPTSPNSRGYIDWTPFFQTWEMKGRYPGDPRRPAPGRGGRGHCSPTRRRLLAKIVAEKWFVPKAVVGFLARQRGRRRHPPLHRRDAARPNSRPSSRSASSSRRAARGRASRSPTPWRPPRPASRTTSAVFVVTAGAEEEAISARFVGANDDYQSIMVKALADRFAEALR